MKKTLTALTAVLLGAALHHASASITIPDGTLTASGEDGYAYAISSTSINAQSGVTHVTGSITGFSLPNVNAGWFEIGLITQSERDRALVTYGVPSYMFNQSAFMLGMKGDSGNVVMPGDYAGDYAGGTGQQQNIGSSFTFDLKLVPSGTAGGTEYLSINGGAYGTGLAYGTDNWTEYGWNLPPEDLSTAYLIAQLYTWDAGQTYSVSFENVTAVPEPTTMMAGALLLLPFGASTLRILRKRLVA
jgi:hypothetical protein